MVIVDLIKLLLTFLEIYLSASSKLQQMYYFVAPGIMGKYQWVNTLSCRTPLTVQFAWVIKFQSQSCVKQQFSLTSGVFTSCPKQSFMTSWHVFLSKSNIFWPEIFSLDKFWFCGSTQKTLKPLVWHLFNQNILIINDFVKVYEKLIIFIKSLILNIFWWKKCLTIVLKVFWVDLRNQNLSKINISWKKQFQLAK